VSHPELVEDDHILLSILGGQGEHGLSLNPNSDRSADDLDRARHLANIGLVTKAKQTVTTDRSRTFTNDWFPVLPGNCELGQMSQTESRRGIFDVGHCRSSGSDTL
jgi:hypothetical protein